MKPEILLYLSDARGIYIPRDFARDTKRECIHGVSAEDLDYLADGPDGEHYWETWDTVEREATILDPSTGTTYSIYLNGDCFLVPVGMEWNEDTESFEWPTE
jgi:hypothetical protein